MKPSSENSSIFDDPTVAMRRIDLTSVLQAFNILDETPFFGISFENYFKFIGGAANSWVYYFVSLGVLFAVPTCMLLLSSANKYRHRILYLFLIIVSLSSESLLVKPLLLYLLFSECLKSNKTERMDRLL